jgi:hypothetical protein
LLSKIIRPSSGYKLIEDKNTTLEQSVVMNPCLQVTTSQIFYKFFAQQNRFLRYIPLCKYIYIYIYIYIWINEHKSLFLCNIPSIMYILVSFILFCSVLEFNYAPAKGESEGVYYTEWSANFGSLIICISWFCAVRCGRVRVVKIVSQN